MTSLTLFANDGRTTRTADLSDDGRYRWMLSRTWDSTLPRIGWVMHNPSTADANEDDPTIRRCVGFARRDGYGGIDVVNLFAYRATSPRDLYFTDEDVIGLPDNRWPLQNLHVDRVVAAWGAGPGEHAPNRVKWVAGSIEAYGFDGWWCLGTTKSGQPRHPLYVKGDQPIVRWPNGHPY